MANEFNQFPIYDPVIKPASLKMSDAWISNLSSFLQTLVGYLSQYGIFVPQITTDQRDSIQSPVEGQLIYNTDAIPGPPVTAELQIWQVKLGVAAWRVVTTV